MISTPEKFARYFLNPWTVFEKVEFLHDHEELNIGNGTVFFLSMSDPPSEKLTIFKIIDFLSSADLTKL